MHNKFSVVSSNWVVVDVVVIVVDTVVVEVGVVVVVEVDVVVVVGNTLKHF